MQLPARAFLMTFALIGIWDAAYLFWVEAHPEATLLCLNAGCEQVRRSSYGVIWGVPLPTYGLVSFCAIAALVLLESSRFTKMISLCLLLLCGAGTIASISLTWIQFAVIHAFCPWCSLSACCQAGCFVCSLIIYRMRDRRYRSLQANQPLFIVLAIALSLGLPLFMYSTKEVSLVDRSLSKKQVQNVLYRPGSHSKGSPDAPNVLVVFADFECPGCRHEYPEIRSLEQYTGSGFRLVFRQLPLIHLHPLAERPAEASECAANQGRFWEAVDYLFSTPQPPDQVAISGMIERLGLDRTEFSVCVENGDEARKIKADLQDAEALGIHGTPTFVLNGTIIAGNVSTLKSSLSRALRHKM